MNTQVNIHVYPTNPTWRVVVHGVGSPPTVSSRRGDWNGTSRGKGQQSLLALLAVLYFELAEFQSEKGVKFYVANERTSWLDGQEVIMTVKRQFAVSAEVTA